MFANKAVRILLYAVILGFIATVAWFCFGLPATFALRRLSQSPEIIVFTEEESETYQKWTRLVEKAPLRDSTRNFLLQYIEAQTSGITVRFLHPLVSADQVKHLDGLGVVSHLDVQAGGAADTVAWHLARLAPSLRVLHLEGNLTDRGFKLICQGLPGLESLYLSNANLEHAAPELADFLPRLRELTLADCNLGREFIESVNGRPDVKALIK